MMTPVVLAMVMANAMIAAHWTIALAMMQPWVGVQVMR